jgi:hypothetical protein
LRYQAIGVQLRKVVVRKAGSGIVRAGTGGKARGQPGQHLAKARFAAGQPAQGRR